MKVLHLISGGDSGGAKTHVFTLLSALCQEIDIRVICFMEGAFYNEIKGMPIPSMLIKQKYRNDFTIIKPLVEHIRQEGYHIIHVHGARANFISMFLRPFVKIPIVTTIHSDPLLDFTTGLYKKYVYTGLNTISLRQMDYYIAVSENFRQMLISRRFPEKDIYTVYNTIDFDTLPQYISRQEFFHRYAIEAEGKKVVGIIGRFDYVKGHDIFLRACAQVLKKRQDVIFLMAGEGDEESSLRALAESLGIGKSIYFLGFVKDIFSFINAIDINVLSSRSESFPYVLLEGAKMEKATVSTDVGGISGLIKENETGLLAPAGDYNALAVKILRFVEDESLRLRLGENLSQYARSNFSKESMKERHLTIYNDIMNRRKAAGKYFDVALFGYYGYGNSGDDALLKSIISSIRKEKEDVSILVMSRRPGETSREHGVCAINRFNILKIMRYLRRTRLLAFGGGSLIQDVTSTRSLLYYILLLNISKRRGLKLMIYGNGIGPIVKVKNVPRARRALDICDYISLRDPESLKEARRLGSKNPNIHVSVDPVFALEVDGGRSFEEIAEGEKIDTSLKYFAVSIRQWRYNEPEFTVKLAGVIDRISQTYSIYPLYIPMRPDDLVIIREVMGKTISRRGVLSRVYPITEMITIIGQMEFAMCMRLHGLIYAVSAGIPVIGLIYDPKVKNFIDYINENTYVDTDRLNPERLFSMASYIMENRELSREKMKRAAARLREMSGRDAKEAVNLMGS